MVMTVSLIASVSSLSTVALVGMIKTLQETRTSFKRLAQSLRPEIHMLTAVSSKMSQQSW